MTKEVLKDYSEYFEPIMELPDSGYCYLEHDMFHATRQNLIQEFLFKNGYDWARTTSDSKRKHEWNHAWSIVWRKIPANPAIDLKEYLDLSWSFDSVIIWDEPFSGLDQIVIDKLISYLLNLKNDSRIIIIVDHDIVRAKKYFGQSLLLETNKLINND